MCFVRVLHPPGSRAEGTHYCCAPVDVHQEGDDIRGPESGPLRLLAQRTAPQRIRSKAERTDEYTQVENPTLPSASLQFYERFAGEFVMVR